MERGIRQGDPISPFIFILFLELLSHMLNKLEIDGDIQGARLGINAPPITHFFFADDILIFCKALVAQASKVISCLDRFCAWTGQSFSLPKSGYFFSSNIWGNLKAEIKQCLYMKELHQDVKYLGHKMFPNKSQRKDFDTVVNRVNSGLKAGSLSSSPKLDEQLVLNTSSRQYPYIP